LMVDGWWFMVDGWWSVIINRNAEPTIQNQKPWSWFTRECAQAHLDKFRV
jgi:hypothetical protein